MTRGNVAAREERGTWLSAAVDLVKVHRQGGSEIRALDGVTVSFEAGRFTAVTGASGSGSCSRRSACCRS